MLILYIFNQKYEKISQNLTIIKNYNTINYMKKESLLNENISFAKEIISSVSNHEKNRFNYKFQRPYIHSNEGDFYKNLKLDGKDVLTVGSSCDQTLYSLLYGAKSVTLFDLNPFVKYFYELKSTAIQTLPMSKTRQLFTIKPKLIPLNFEKIIEKLSPLMSEESQEFWSSLGKEFSHK